MQIFKVNGAATTSCLRGIVGMKSSRSDGSKMGLIREVDMSEVVLDRNLTCRKFMQQEKCFNCDRSKKQAIW